MKQEIIKDIHAWFERAVPKPKPINQAVQIGCHFEEIAEMMQALKLNNKEPEKIAYTFKQNSQYWSGELQTLSDEQQTALLDSLCDQIVTAVGVAYMLDMDIKGALEEVNRSNWSKFVDGQPVFDKNGKIAKPDTYKAPNLKPFIHGWD